MRCGAQVLLCCDLGVIPKTSLREYRGGFSQREGRKEGRGGVATGSVSRLHLLMSHSPVLGALCPVLPTDTSEHGSGPGVVLAVENY